MTSNDDTVRLNDRLGQVIYETDNFVCFTGVMQEPTYKGIVGYRIMNKDTGVVEQETNSAAMSIRLCHKAEVLKTMIEEDPDGSKADAATAHQERSFLEQLSDGADYGGMN